MFRLTIESPFDSETLCRRWDDRTSVSRFAGNDDEMDNVFMALRKDRKVRLVRKARSALDPFATVFWGKISPDGPDGKSGITGFFGKSVLDYILLAVMLGLDVFLFVHNAAGGKLNAGLVTGCIAFLLLLCILAFPMKSARLRYADFMRDIAGAPPESDSEEGNRDE